MPEKRPTSPPLVGIGILIALALVQVVVFFWGSWFGILQGVAFFLGAGGMMVMFARWRTQGDDFAKVPLFAAIGTWALSVAVASVEDGFGSLHAAYWIAGLALLIGFSGGVVTVVRMYLRREMND